MSKANEQVRELFICNCGSVEHQFLISYWNDHEGWDETYVEIHLTKQWPIWRRIVLAVKYIFGYQCRYGAFQEVVLHPDQVRELRDKLNTRIDWFDQRDAAKKMSEIVPSEYVRTDIGNGGYTLQKQPIK